MLDTTQSILRSATRFFSGTMLSRITGMLRDISMAYLFGTQSTIAALLVAFRFAHLLRRLFGEGALQTAFIPYFEELRKENLHRAGQFFCDLAMSLTAFLTSLITVSMLILGTLYYFVDFSAGNSEILWLTFLMMPSLLFICLFGINASLMQCEKSYFVPSAAPVAFNLVWIIGLFSVASLPSSSAMSWLAIFVILACVAQWALTLPKTISILRNFNSTGFWKYSRFFSYDVTRLFKPLMLGIIGVAASQINNALDAVFARWASEEGPAFLWYAIRIQQLPLALFGVALSGALLPPLARALKNKDTEKYQQFLEFALQSSIFLMLPITAALFVMGDDVINLIYGRGDFFSSSVIETTRSLWGYTTGLIPMVLILILAPAFYSRGDYQTPSKAAVGSMILNVVLNTLFIGFFGLGAASVALATGISAWFNLIWLVSVLHKEQGLPISSNLLTQISKICLVGCLASISVLSIDRLIWGYSSFVEILQGKQLEYSQEFWQQISHFGLNSSVFILVFGVASIALKLINPKVLKVKDILNKV